MDGESFIFPTIENDADLKIMNSSSWTVVKPTNSKNEKDTSVDSGNMVVTISTLGLLQDNNLHPTHLDRLSGTHLTEDKALCAIHKDNLDRPKDETKDRKSILPHPPIFSKNVVRKKLPSTGNRLLFFCILFLLVVNACLIWKLNVSRKLSSQLQEELYQTTDLLNSYRAHQEWTINKAKKNNKKSFDIGNCWLGASVRLGPCASDRLENLRNTYKNTLSFFDEGLKWWTVPPIDSSLSYNFVS